MRNLLIVPERAMVYCRGDEEMRRCVGCLPFYVKTYSDYYGSKWDGTSTPRLHTTIECEDKEYRYDLSPEFMRSFEKFKESNEHQYTFTIVSDADKLKAIKEILEIKCTL